MLISFFFRGNKRINNSKAFIHSHSIILLVRNYVSSKANPSIQSPMAENFFNKSMLKIVKLRKKALTICNFIHRSKIELSFFSTQIDSIHNKPALPVSGN
jgi:hypothetical protein